MKFSPRIGWAALIAGLLLLAGIGMWKTASDRPPSGSLPPRVLVKNPAGVMGTSCQIAAIVKDDLDADRAGTAMKGAEAALRGVESRMSRWIEESEVSRLNRAPVGESVALSPDVMTVLKSARNAAAVTDGAFDITCRPLLLLWKEAGRRGAPPTEAEIAAAQQASRWSFLELTEEGAVKTGGEAQIDLGGIAKGYAIDRAIEDLQISGIPGGLVDVGGDLRCYGSPPDGSGWVVDIQSPFGEGVLGKVRLREGKAVCTSGGYARFTEIQGKRYSHIVDPRTGYPVDAVPSVTVIAPTAMEADIWATALSVLGPEGLSRLPDGVEALLIQGDSKNLKKTATAGFPAVEYE